MCHVTMCAVLLSYLPGHKPSVTSHLEDTASVVSDLAAAVAAATGLTVADQKVLSSFQLQHRWFAEVREAGGEVMYA